MTSIRASIASRATELRPTASSEKSRERARFPLCLFLACSLVSHCACCQDFPPPPSLPRLDSPSLRPSLAAVQLRELLQAGSFAVRSDVRPQLSVRALPSESPVHSPLQRGRASASWLDEALRSPSPLRPVSATPPSQPGSFSVSAFEVVSSAAPPHSGSICPGPLAAAPSIASPPTPVVSPNPVACPRRWADGRPNSAYRPRGFDEVRPCSAPSSPSLRIPVSSSTFSFSPPPVSSALPAPPLPRGTLPAHILPPLARAPFTSASCLHSGARLQPVSPSSVHFPPVAAPAPKAGVALSTAGRVHSAMLVLSARWVAILCALASASALFVDCQASSNPEAHMTRSIAKFAPSTLERYFDQWSSWSRHCELAGFHPASPPPGFLPDWIASRASAQGLATAPLKALAWMCKTAGLPALRDALSSPLCRAFAVASAPSEHRESLPLSLSFFVWLEQSVLDPGTAPAQVLRLGFVLVCVWASLRWGDSIWVPPARLQYQLSVQALVGVSVRTKTTKRGMPWGLLAHGFLGSPASSWALRFLSCLRQAVSDTLAIQPSRTLDFLPAVLSGSESRPLISEPWDRDRFVPWLRDLLCQHWSLHSREPLPPVFSLIAAQSLKATMLSWARQLSIESDARRIQGHHRLSGADRSVALYSRDDIIPMVRSQARVVAAFRSGFRPLQPVARGLVAPLDDFPVVLPSGSLPSLDSAALPPDCLPDVPVPPPVTSPPAPTDSPPPLPMLPDPSAPASEDDLVSLSSEESEAPPADQDEVEDWEADLVEKAAIKAASAAPWLMHNPRSNVVHFTQTCTSDTLRSIRMLRQDGSAVHVRPACGAQTCQMIPGPLLSAPPAGSVLCLRGACFSRLSQLD